MWPQNASCQTSSFSPCVVFEKTRVSPSRVHTAWDVSGRQWLHIIRRQSPAYQSSMLSLFRLISRKRQHSCRIREAGVTERGNLTARLARLQTDWRAFVNRLVSFCQDGELQRDARGRDFRINHAQCSREGEAGVLMQSPDGSRGILGDEPIGCENCESVNDRLAHQHEVERVPV